MNRVSISSCITLAALSLLTGCASYAVPGSGANLQAMRKPPKQMSEQTRSELTDPAVRETLDRKPLAKFPAAVAVVRVQGSDYTDRTAEVFGRGNFKAVVTRDVEKPEQFAVLQQLPMLLALEPINRLELPQTIDGLDDLRAAAATLHADMLLIYTFDDKFEDHDDVWPLTVLTLGIAPTKRLTVTSTASAILIDTRNGYVYGAAEAVAKQTATANDWGEDVTAEQVRQHVEENAFAQLVVDLKSTWNMVLHEYAPPTAPGH